MVLTEFQIQNYEESEVNDKETKESCRDQLLDFGLFINFK